MSSNSPEFNAAIAPNADPLEELVANQISRFFRLSKHLTLSKRSVFNRYVVEYDSPWFEFETGGSAQVPFLASKALFSRNPLQSRIAELYVPQTEPPYLGCRKCIARFDPDANKITKPFIPDNPDILPESDAWNSLEANLTALEAVPFVTIIGHMIVQRGQPFFDPYSSSRYYGA